MGIIRGVIKNGLINFFGLDVKKFIPGSSPSAQLKVSLAKFNIDIVFDVGANTGQFGKELRSSGYDGQIVSFEPLSEAYMHLKNLCDTDKKWTAHPRCAVGERAGFVTINVAGNSASSSLLPMLDSHILAAPHTAYIGKEEVEIQMLDSIIPGYLDGFKNPLLKIDTQGYEWAVLDGSKEVLSLMMGVVLEMSLVPLYEGQHLWGEIIERLEGLGFSLWALQPEFIDPCDGRTLQVNGIFYRNVDFCRSEACFLERL